MTKFLQDNASAVFAYLGAVTGALIAGAFALLDVRARNSSQLYLHEYERIKSSIVDKGIRSIVAWLIVAEDLFRRPTNGGADAAFRAIEFPVAEANMLDVRYGRHWATTIGEIKNQIDTKRDDIAENSNCIRTSSILRRELAWYEDIQLSNPRSGWLARVVLWRILRWITVKAIERE